MAYSAKTTQRRKNKNYNLTEALFKPFENILLTTQFDKKYEKNLR